MRGRARSPSRRRTGASGGGGSEAGSSPAVLAEAVADPAYGLDRTAVERPVDLVAQVPDVDVDEIRAGLEAELPGAFEQLASRQSLAAPAEQQLEQGELLRRQLELRLAAPGAPGRRIEAQIARLQKRRAFRGRTANEGSEARQQLRERERLQQVVIRARVEAVDAIADRIARGEHQHRCPDALLAKLPAGREAVESGQHHVEDDRVVRCRAGHPEGVLAARSDVCDMALFAQAARDEGCHLRLVFDHEHTHRLILATANEKAMRAFTLFSSGLAPLPAWKRSLANVARLERPDFGRRSPAPTETPA